MFEKLSSDEFSFNVKQDSEGLHSTITQTTTGKVKRFFQKVGDQGSMLNHLHSLTDDQCRSFMKNTDR